jgi:hypothetical protein
MTIAFVQIQLVGMLTGPTTSVARHTNGIQNRFEEFAVAALPLGEDKS